MKTKSLIAAFLLAASSTFSQVPSYVPTNGLNAWYSFNGNVIDESGNGNNGTAMGATLTTDRFGNSNGAYHFNGLNNYLQLPASFLNGNQVSSFTIHSSFKVNSFPNTQGWGQNIWGKTLFWGEVNIEIQQDSSIRLFFANSYSGNKYSVATTSPGSIHSNQWFNFDIIYQNSSAIIFLNGIQVPTSLVWYSQSGAVLSTSQIESVCDFSAIANSSRFGTRSVGGAWGSYLDGIIDEFGIWNRALTQQEITALYNTQTCNSSSNTITADGPTTFCAGNSVNLTSDVVGGTYQWRRNGINITTNGTSQTFKASTTGSYTCVATCNGTALTSNAIAVTSKTNASATVTASGATSFCLGDSLTLNCTNLGSNYSVQWYRTNVSMENATNYSLVVKQPGTYKVVTKNLTNGCSRISGSSVVVAVNCRLANPDVVSAELVSTDLDAKVAGEDPKGKIYIYPNPTSDNKFTVELMGLELNGDATLEVYNAIGQILSYEKVNIANGTLNRIIQIDEQSKGQLCLVRLIAGSEVYDSKVILK